jgi:outer membrane protein assembly factor BamB
MPRLRSLVVLLVGCALASAADWPHWLGPNRDGSSPEKILPWKKAPKQSWRFPTGQGFSAPVVAGGRVFVHAQVKDKDAEEVIALNAKTGKLLWRKSYPRGPYKSMIGTGPRATPAVFLDKVYAYGITGILSCFRAKDGKLLWQVDAYKKFKAKLPRFGVCCSPLVEGNRVLVSVGGKGTSFAAFDSEKGDVLWKRLNEPASTTSPVIFMYNPKKRETVRDVIFLTGQGLVSLSPLNGKLSWKYALADRPFGSAPTPACVGNLIVTSSMRNGATAVRPVKRDGRLTVERVWQNPALTVSFATPVTVGKRYVYMVTSVTSPEVTSSLNCVDLKTGKVLWTHPKVGDHHAALLRTGDNKLLMLTDSGTLKLLDPNPKAYRELATGKVSGPTFVNPALADGRLYLRDGKGVACLQLTE